MAAINKGNVFITSGTVSGDTITGGITVEIDTVKIDHNLADEIIEFNIPVTPSNDTTQAPESNLIDLKKIKHIVTIQGEIVTDSTSTGFEKKRDLMILAGYGSTAEDSLMVGQTKKSAAVTLVYGLSSQSSQHKVIGNIVKLQITQTPGKGSDGVTTDTKAPFAYNVQVQLSVGKERKSA